MAQADVELSWSGHMLSRIGPGRCQAESVGVDVELSLLGPKSSRVDGAEAAQANVESIQLGSMLSHCRDESV